MPRDAAVRLGGPPLDFLGTLEAAPTPALIAEVKKASPSRGVIREDFDPVAIARSYRAAGAHALSVLTDHEFFQGSPAYLAAAKKASGLPCLRKDFIVDPYQVVQARTWGADALLLIVAALDAPLLSDLLQQTQALGMAALVEVHSEAEAETALRVGARLIGINNRDLADFRTSLEVTERIAPLVVHHAFLVSESALACRADIDRVVAAGARGVLIGSAFTEALDIEAKVREVMGW